MGVRPQNRARRCLAPTPRPSVFSVISLCRAQSGAEARCSKNSVFKGRGPLLKVQGEEPRWPKISFGDASIPLEFNECPAMAIRSWRPWRQKFPSDGLGLFPFLRGSAHQKCTHSLHKYPPPTYSQCKHPLCRRNLQVTASEFWLHPKLPQQKSRLYGGETEQLFRKGKSGLIRQVFQITRQSGQGFGGAAHRFCIAQFCGKVVRHARHIFFIQTKQGAHRGA